GAEQTAQSEAAESAAAKFEANEPAGDGRQRPERKAGRKRWDSGELSKETRDGIDEDERRRNARRLARLGPTGQQQKGREKYATAGSRESREQPDAAAANDGEHGEHTLSGGCSRARRRRRTRGARAKNQTSGSDQQNGADDLLVQVTG